MKLGISVRFFLFYTDIFPVITILPLCHSDTPLCHRDHPSTVISTEVERSLRMASLKNSLMG
ncbi:hypothetical protein [Massilibacteroides vaginae]|uniref:hypothetical protein n=1 Tax=Massilibacteroides vaginae TaxID=1673718 RepID=UPI00111C75A0|nr:hypothetical protein [Massilibacteroides vaginae]